MNVAEPSNSNLSSLPLLPSVSESVPIPQLPPLPHVKICALGSRFCAFVPSPPTAAGQLNSRSSPKGCLTIGRLELVWMLVLGDWMLFSGQHLVTDSSLPADRCRTVE